MSKLLTAQSFPCFLEKEFNPFFVACNLFAGRLVRDRFNVLNQYSDLNWSDRTDALPEPEQRSMTELMDQRAQELLGLGKSIAVQWSGGVDSSALLLALIKNGIKKDDIQILYDKNSAEEYPKLLNWLQEQSYPLTQVVNWRRELSHVHTGLITNGWCADQLFGSMFFHECPEMYSDDLETFLAKVPMRRYNIETLNQYLPKDQTHETADIFRKYAKDVFDLDLTIAAELGWFINFTCKWTWVSTFNDLYLSATRSAFKTRVFYDTPYFQGWALNNFSKIKEANIYGSDASHYKRELKEYCNSVFPDQDYLLNKTKHPSWNARSAGDMPETPRVAVQTEEGIEIFNVPFPLPRTVKEFYSDPFFTKHFK